MSHAATGDPVFPQENIPTLVKGAILYSVLLPDHE
jgi:hypothetical protein